MPTLLMLRTLPWKLIGLSALALAFLGMFAALKIEQAQNGKLKAQIEKVNAELRRISTAKDEQAKRTEGKLVETRIIYRDAGKQAEQIEKAPTAPECRTPPEIMGADL